MNIRDQITALISTALDGYRIIPAQRTVDQLAERTCILAQGDIEPGPSPAGLLTVHYTATVISPLTDMEAAERDLDDAVIETITALDELPGVIFERATKVIWKERNLAYDITFTITTQHEQENPNG